MADASVFLMKSLSAEQLYSLGIPHINIGSGDEISIKELAFIIKDIVGYIGEISFNNDYPDGMPRKFLDVSRLNKMGWKSKIKLNDGIQSVYEWYVKNYS